MVVPFPNLENIQDGHQVPLKENYYVASMAYLDTPQARPIFEIQADIIIERQCKGIVDVGCRLGNVLDILYERGYTEFEYMGFDTSIEPIALAIDKWKDYNNIEFRNESWNDKASFIVDFPVDMVLFSAVLLYRPNDHFEFFTKVVTEYYKSPNALIQEPCVEQRHWDKRLVMNTIQQEFDVYKKAYDVRSIFLDLEIFAGKREILDVQIHS